MVFWQRDSFLDKFISLIKRKKNFALAFLVPLIQDPDLGISSSFGNKKKL